MAFEDFKIFQKAISGALDIFTLFLAFGEVAALRPSTPTYWPLPLPRVVRQQAALQERWGEGVYVLNFYGQPRVLVHSFHVYRRQREL
jgi:hypothetical protein